MKHLICLVSVLLVTCTARAERPPQSREKADLVVTGKVTTRPTKPLPAAYGQDHKLKEKDVATFWLMKNKDSWSVIYNAKGVEKTAKE